MISSSKLIELNRTRKQEKDGEKIELSNKRRLAEKTCQNIFRYFLLFCWLFYKNTKYHYKELEILNLYRITICFYGLI